ncbi:NAD(P)-dependent oxidoreductase [Labrys wisconsinensis]|uniref:D-3-phosphoglycerate dehydrogenase n=1 Tax=Labrys wisconsinensis TaxID=425677 RepID=A0ABU0J526_9HYPH|nr:NAD(P)-dependent oxidoreductase [Labrys wisconsinensis]MDQ0469362.1 D-3-phosphoglycerate dehydrogenase [Labrys wisconsinensis]
MTAPRIGLTADLFDSRGRPMFGTGPLDLLAQAGLTWTRLPPDGGAIDPAAVADFDALLIGGSRLGEASLARDGGRLRIVARNGVGHDAVDGAALARRGILLTNSPVAVRHPVAAMALAFMLALGMRLPLKARLAREARWAERGDFPGTGLPGRTLAIVGVGGIGRELVRLVQPFGMRILAADPFVAPAQLAGLPVELMPLEAALAQADFVVIACLLNETTRKLIDAPRLALMKPTAFLINVARGPIVDEAALIAALQAGSIAGAGLDVFEREPADPANPLLAMDTVIATPHSLCWTDGFVDGVARDAIKGIVAAMQGRLPDHVVNPDAIGHGRVGQWLGKSAGPA